MKTVRVIVPVWGEKYVNAFLRLGLPALCAPGNLATRRSDARLSLWLMTRPEDVARLRSAPGVAAAARTLPVQVRVPAGADFARGGYAAFNACYLDALRAAYRDRAAVMPLTADQIWSAGSLDHLLDCAAHGARAVLAAGLRVLEAAGPDLETALAASRAGLAPETLARLAFARLHPWDRALVHDAHNTAQPASFQLWQAGEQGLVLRCLHLHPAYLELSRRPGALRRTIDAGSLIREQCPDSSRLHVVADSDQAMHISLAPAEQSAHLVAYPRGNWRALANWALTMGISRHNLFYLRHSIRIHAGPVDPHDWIRAETLAAEFCDPAIAWLDNPVKLWAGGLVHSARNSTLAARLPGGRRLWRALKKRLHLEY